MQLEWYGQSAFRLADDSPRCFRIKLYRRGEPAVHYLSNRPLRPIVKGCYRPCDVAFGREPCLRRGLWNRPARTGADAWGATT